MTWIEPSTSGARPSIRAPGSGSWTPVRIFTSVDLPDPFWPTSATISPAETAKSTPSSARRPGNVLLSPATVSSLEVLMRRKVRCDLRERSSRSLRESRSVFARWRTAAISASVLPA